MSNSEREWIRVRRPDPAGIIFAPPLIGGTFHQQVRLYRPLIQHSFDLIGFNYPGHGGGNHKFSLKAALTASQEILEMAVRAGRAESLPLLGVAACFGAVPLLHGAGRMNEPFDKLVLVNPIVDLGPGLLLKSFMVYNQKIHRKPGIIKALESYLNYLFPNIHTSRHAFGVLKRTRARLFKTLFDLFTVNPLNRVRLRSTPTLCLSGREDRLLKILGFISGYRHEEAVRRVCPRMKFRELTGDHFLTPLHTRRKAFNEILGFIHGNSL